MCEQITENQHAAMEELAEQTDIFQPVKREILEPLAIDQIKSFASKLYWRVKNKIYDDLKMVISSLSKEIIPENHPYRKLFFIDFPGNSIRIKYKDELVYCEQSEFAMTGKWIIQLADWANQVRAELEIQADLEARHGRENLIKRLTATV